MADLLQSFSESAKEEKERNNARAARRAAPDHTLNERVIVESEA